MMSRPSIEAERSVVSHPAARATAPAPPQKVEGHVVALTAPGSFEAEQYRTLNLVLERMQPGRPLRVIAVSSPAVGDGKTTTTVNLAVTMAQNPAARVLLVDADVRRPAVGRKLGLGKVRLPGLVELIADPGLGIDGLARRVGPANLSVLLAGRSHADPFDVLRSPRFEEFLRQARESYDSVVLDTPPLLMVPDCRQLSAWVDGILLVVAAHRTPRRLVEEALNVMEPDRLVGLVFNGDDRPLSGYYRSYRAYGYPPRLARAAARRPRLR